MKLKSTILYSLGILMLVFGNRDFWEKLSNERELQKEQEKLSDEAEKETHKKFEVQHLVYDSATSKFTNPATYFQIVNIGNVNFKAIKKQSKTKIDADDNETASDSN